VTLWKATKEEQRLYEENTEETNISRKNSQDD
jgi:hypothetical protein